MRMLAVLAGVMLAVPVVASEPSCVEADAALFASAQAAHRAGRFDEALAMSERLSQCHPGNDDFQRALALAVLGRDDAALDAARTASALAPEYAAVAALVARLEARARSAPAESQAPAAAPEDPPARAAPSAQWTAMAMVAAHELSGGRDGWNDAALTLRRTAAKGVAIGGGISLERRGSVTDYSLSGDVLYPVAPRTRVTGRLGVTPGSAFRPGLLVAAGAEHDLVRGWVVRGELAQRRFDGDRADSATVGADYYVGSFRLAGGVSAVGTVFSADWYASNRQRYRLTASIGDELDTIDEGGTVVESRVRSITIAGEHGLSPRLSLGWWIGTVEQGNFYDRHYAGLTVTRRY